MDRRQFLQGGLATVVAASLPLISEEAEASITLQAKINSIKALLEQNYDQKEVTAYRRPGRKGFCGLIGEETRYLKTVRDGEEMFYLEYVDNTKEKKRDLIINNFDRDDGLNFRIFDYGANGFRVIVNRGEERWREHNKVILNTRRGVVEYNTNLIPLDLVDKLERDYENLLAYILSLKLLEQKGRGITKRKVVYEKEEFKINQ